jgi:two-component system, cell cycle response regulator
MDLNKYKNLLFQKIKQQTLVWFEESVEAFISNTEVYRFLHSIHGSSGTLQLGGLHQLSGSLMKEMDETIEKQWDKNELRNFLHDLLTLTYEYENFNENENTKEMLQSENVPLIQIIDDDVSMLIFLKDAFEEKGWMTVVTTNPEKAISQYIEMNPDCVIIDINLPNKNGFEILDDLVAHNNHQFVPKMMMSIINNRETRIKALKMGADDFVEKPIDLEELLAKMERLLGRKKLYDESVLLDELTKVYNRKWLKDVFVRNLNDLKRYNQVFSIAFIDLDHFKNLNDSFGHLTGDQVLVKFANFLKENTRSSDIVFRFGGEEFVVLFQNTRQSEAVEIVSRLLNEFSRHSFEKDQQTFYITFSAGVYTINNPDTMIVDAINAADQALYKAKAAGRARVETINQPLENVVKKKLFITIIDDDDIIRTMLMRILKTMEFEQLEIDVEAFSDGIKFFESQRLEKSGEHFLILDGVMPVMDGIEILQRVKKERNLLVLMLTGRKSESDIEKALKLGADDYITKPFSIKELQARIQRLITRMK